MKHVCNFPKPKAKPDGWECFYCRKIFRTRRELVAHIHSCHLRKDGFSWNKGLDKTSDSRILKYSKSHHEKYALGKIVSPMKGKHLSAETKEKISKSMGKFLENNPEKTPWLANHSSKPSYPEKYFLKLFRKTHTPLQYHRQVGRYELDFSNEEKHFYLEVDGEQHYLEKNINRDEKRRIFLEKLGWHGVRIRWKTWQKMSKEYKRAILFFLHIFFSGANNSFQFCLALKEIV